MRRRDFVAGVTSLAVAPSVAAQPVSNARTLAIVDVTRPQMQMREDSEGFYGLLFAELRRLGQIEGKNLRVERYGKEQSLTDATVLAAQVVRASPDVMFVLVPFSAVSKETSKIPIVTMSGDPIAAGYAQSLARPGGNITGVSVDAGPSIHSKRIALLREMFPSMSKLGCIAGRVQWERGASVTLRNAAETAGVSLVTQLVDVPGNSATYRNAIEEASRGGADAIMVLDNPDVLANRVPIAQAIADVRIPAIHAFVQAVDAGGLMAYSFDFNEVGRRLYYFKSPLDGITRISFYKRSDRFPIIVLATRAQDEVLATWRQNAITRMIFIIALTVLIAVIGFFVVRQLVRGQRLVSDLAAQEADFRLLAENSSDMVTRIGMDELIQYASPSSIRVVGWSPEQLVGTPALAGVNTEDLPEVQAIVAALRRGEERDARIVYRSRHRKKTEVWIESTMRVTKELGTDKINGVVAISRDMTDHKDFEQKLESLATTDGLTGIANRRHFDEHLEREWARARREGAALSILLIDVDHFKTYNDRYGHQAGDACLKAIAQTLAAQARRPADLAARYGGEEFVLLLPDTDRAGCELMAKKIRDCLADLAINHEFNMPSQIVTVSIGGAIATLHDAKASSSSVVEDADRALYAAKDGGRDRFVMSARVIELPSGRIA